MNSITYRPATIPAFCHRAQPRPVYQTGNSYSPQTQGDQVHFSAKPRPDKENTGKRRSNISALSSNLKAPLAWAARRGNEALLKKEPTRVDQATVRHEFGHVLVSSLSRIPQNGLFLTLPEVRGAKLMVAEEPQNANDLLRHVVMRMAGHASDKSLPQEAGWTKQSWNHYVNAQSCHDFADIVDLLKVGRQKKWLNIPVETLPDLDAKRFKHLCAMDNDQMTPPEREEYLTFLEQLDEVARFPLVKDAIETAQRIYTGLSESQLCEITGSLERQSFFSGKAIDHLVDQHIPPKQKSRLSRELERFVQRHLDANQPTRFQ